MSKLVSEVDNNASSQPKGPIKRLYRWVLHWADTPYGTPALFVLSFAESSFFPIPPDVLQIALSVSKPRRSFFYATVSGVASVLGALLGWYIGFALWSGLESFFFDYVPGFTPENFEYVQTKYHENAFLAIALAGFTPIPYKVFTIAAGVCSVHLQVLILASIVGRFARFYCVAVCIFFFGPTIKEWLEKYFELATIVFGVLLVGGFLVIKYLL